MTNLAFHNDPALAQMVRERAAFHIAADAAALAAAYAAADAAARRRQADKFIKLLAAA